MNRPSHSDSRDNSVDDKVGIVVAHAYKLKKKLGQGSFGEIYSAYHVQTKKEVAVKVELLKTNSPQLASEYKVLGELAGGKGIPVVHTISKEKIYQCMVMELLGPSLEELFGFCDRKFSLKTVLMLADQMLHLVEYAHVKNYLHRDIKSDNFLMGNGNHESTVFLIDYGLAKRYRHPTTHVHIPFRDGKKLTGTARYASINTHLGHENGRRDDLESLGYVLVYFIKGGLPWQGLHAATKKQKYELIREKKQSISPNELCDGHPQEFAMFLNIVRGLRFGEEPDYTLMHQLFGGLFRAKSYQHDFEFDWTIKKRAAKPPRRQKSPGQTPSSPPPPPNKPPSNSNTAEPSRNTATGPSKNTSSGPNAE